MESFEFDLQIPAHSLEEATRKANAAGILLEKLTVEELVKLAHIIIHDPEKRKMAKRFLGINDD